MFSYANHNENMTILYFNSIRNNPSMLEIFIKEMPKGADIHIHLLGATYAENLINYGKNDDLCINPKNNMVFYDGKCPSNLLLSKISKNGKLYNQLIDAWSLLNFVPTPHESEHDHFFKAFKFFPILNKHRGNILAELIQRAQDEKVTYLELLIFTDFDKVLSFANKVQWNNNFRIMRENFINKCLNKIVSEIHEQVLVDEKKAESKIDCSINKKQNQCHVLVRYQYQAIRNNPPKLVFAMLLTAFELANRYPNKFVGVNLVGPEDDFLSLQNYKLQMKMIAYLHSVYPNVKISLHAGELRFGLAPPEDLLFHINDAVNVAHANRIGHGVDIAYEKNSLQLLHELAKKHILVEINLTSNAKILGIKGKYHPFMLYLSHNVPLALSTDDDGVLRTDMNNEFFRAAQTYKLSYLTLKKLARNSLTYNFLPGLSLWKNPETFIPISSCSSIMLNLKNPSKKCLVFLNENMKAKLQWNLEKQFNSFEEKFS